MLWVFLIINMCWAKPSIQQQKSDLVFEIFTTMKDQELESCNKQCKKAAQIKINRLKAELKKISPVSGETQNKEPESSAK